MTKAELSRRLQPGAKLRLVECLLGLVPADKQARTVSTAKGDRYGMLKVDGAVSTLAIQPGEEVVETQTGFAVYGPDREGLPLRVYARYDWDHEEARGL